MGRWIWVLAVVAACGKEKAANRAALDDVKTKLATLESCLTDKQDPDFATAFALVLDRAANATEPLACFAPARAALAAAVGALATKLGEPAPVPSVVPARIDLARAADVCGDLRGLVSTINGFATKLGAPPVETPLCDLDRLQVVFTAAPSKIASDSPDLRIQDGALIVHADDKYRSLDTSFPTIGRMVENEWDLRDAPKNMHRFTWPADGPVVITWQVKGQRTIMIDDGKGGWTAGAKTPIDGVESIWRSGNRVTVVGFEKGKEDTTIVRRSLDGGKTLGPPIPLMTGKSQIDATRVRADGSVVSIGGATERGSLRAVRLAPDAIKTESTLEQTWPETGTTTNQIALCGAGDVYWALHRSHLLRSDDVGQSWKQIGTLAAEPRFPRLECSATVLAVWSKADGDHRDLAMCTPAGCAKPIDIPFAPSDTVGFQLEPTPELWLGHRRGEEPFVITANRINATGLARQRVMIAKPLAGGEGAVHEGKTFVLMHRAFSTLY